MKIIKWSAVVIFLLTQIWIAYSLHCIANDGVNVWGQIEASQSGHWYIGR